MSATVTFDIVDSWATGLVGSFSIANDASPEAGWQVEFDAPFTITQVWNAEIVSAEDGHYVVRNLAYNADIAAGTTITFGLQATSDGQLAADVVGGIAFQGIAAPPPLPRLSVADASVAEGDAGTAALNFTVTLSAPAEAAVTVGFATADGSAAAGSDYTARSGTVTFAPGQTTATIAVLAISDTVREANETLTLTLSAPTGATLADASGTGTIRNDDLPPGGGGSPGALSTSGNQIIDAAGNAVRLGAVNWFGMETERFAPDGLNVRSYQSMMDQMLELGFNSIRLPFSGDAAAGGQPTSINYALNPGLQGLNSQGVMDAIIAYAGEIGLKIILDHHRSGAGSGPNGNGLWYDAQHPESQWIAMWEELAGRYAGNATVVGADLHNEPHGVAWGDWAAAAERAGNAIHAVNPDWLIIVEGVDQYNGSYYWWGGNLQGVADRPVVLEQANKLVYSPHDYPNSVFPQPWFQGADFAANLPDIFRQQWGFIHEQGIAPVLIGEFGSKLQDPKDAPWLEALTSYIGGDLDNDGDHDLPPGELGASWAWWSWNPNSGDTGGILQDDWISVQQAKLDALAPILPEPFVAVGGPTDGPDSLVGTAAADVIGGLAGDDVLDGIGGNDTLDGGDGQDTLRGGDGDDQLEGGRAKDLLQGGNGADRLTGGGSNDRLDGGAGRDTLSGNGGADIFVAGRGMGADTVSDFTAGTDRIDLRGLGIEDLDAALAVASVARKGTVFDFGDGDTLLLRGVTAALGSGDFLFAG